MRGKPEQTKRRILSAASKLFYSKGIRAVGVDAIAAEAAVTKRTLYKHYKSKDALISAYLEAQNEPVLAALVESVTGVSGDIVEQIAGLFHALGQQCEKPTWHGCPFARAVSEMRESTDDTVSKIAGNHKRTFEDWLAHRLALNYVDEPSLVARQIMILLDGVITQLLIHRDPAYAVAAAGAAALLLKQRLAE